jgi:hypothetical protein
MGRITDRVGVSTGGSGDSRAQTAPLAVILVLAMVIAGSTLVIAVGGQAISETQTRLDGERAENTMTQFDSQAAMVAIGSASVQEVSLESSGASKYTVRNESGWMNVSYTDGTSGDVTTVYNSSMGAVSRSSGDSTLAYQGGGVWRSDGEGSVMVSPPEFHYRDATLTLPMVQVRGDSSLNRRATVTHNSTTQHYPDQDNSDFRNPLDDGRVEVTVQSEYYEAWGKYFMTRTDGDVEYDHSNGRVTLELVTPPESTTVTSALAAGAGGNLNVQGTGGGPGSCADWNYLDSYNSSNTLDDYCSQTHGTNGNVTYAGDITMSGSADFEGSIRGGGYVHLTGSSYVTEDVYYSSGSEPSNSRVGGSVEQIAGVESASPINTHVAGRVNDVEGDNDNGDPGVPIDGSDRLTGSDPTLESGTYYLERVDMGSSSVDSLEIDTTGGDVTIAVNDYIHVSDGGYDITVTGSNDVRFYVNTSEKEGGSTGLHVGQSSEIATPHNNATQLYVYGKDDFNATIQGAGSSNRARFSGVIYAPSSSDGPGTVTVGHGDVYGGIVTGTANINTQAGLHYDEALAAEQALAPDADVVQVTYLHISVNSVNVTSG